MRETKLIEGWGVNDVTYGVYRYVKANGKRKIVWRCPYYEDWVSLLKRCLSKNFHERHPTYLDCTVCAEWRYLSNFIKWVDSQPNRDWEDCQLDKDFLIDENKHYSPDTCVYIQQGLNLFIKDSTKKRGGYMVGVSVQNSSKANPYRAHCRNPFTLKLEHLGLFPTELEAHLAWKSKKHEHACALADLQEDERVAKRLREMYSPDKDLTKL